MKPIVGILAGGDSKEIIISIKSAQTVYNLVDKDQFEVYNIHLCGKDWDVVIEEEKYPVDRSDFSFSYNGQKIIIDYALIMIHGTPGEDGLLQAYFDLLKIPYSTCGFFESALTFNKHACKLYLKEYGVLSADAVIVRRNENYDVNAIASRIGFPCFVKPNEGGSSFGTTKAKNLKELNESVQLAFKEDNEVIIEVFIEGREVTCGVIKTRNNYYRLPPTEIVSKNDFFDYDAKYEGKSDEITPAHLPDEMINECQDISSRIYDLLHCNGIVRVDYIIKNNRFYFLEINTVPGMSAASIIPQQAKAAGIDLTRVFTEMINDAIS
ncbi:MAG: D-alanine--D-alanine ligase [Bacteroidota bacterium]